jgi:hypothetical protein
MMSRTLSSFFSLFHRELLFCLRTAKNWARRIHVEILGWFDRLGSALVSQRLYFL